MPAAAKALGGQTCGNGVRASSRAVTLFGEEGQSTQNCNTSSCLSITSVNDGEQVGQYQPQGQVGTSGSLYLTPSDPGLKKPGD